MGGGSFTESTLLDLVSDDGSSGFMLRIARHVDEGIGWVWLVTYHDGMIHGYVADDLVCPRTRTDDNGESASFDIVLPTAHGARAQLERLGSAVNVAGGSCVVDVRGHHATDIPRGSGDVAMRLQATFRPRFDHAGSNLPGRTESIVDVVADIDIAGRRISMTGLGQFHEQVQDAPRFDTPFTYVSLRGRDSALVGIRGPRAGGAVLQTRAGTFAVPAFEIDALDSEASMTTRSFRAGADREEGAAIKGHAIPTIRYSIPLMSGRRPSAIVVGRLIDEAVSGFINDWQP